MTTATTSPFHISTDKTSYTSNEDVIVTASINGWYPGKEGKSRLVIWIKGTGTHIADEYVTKPTTGDTVKWTVKAASFANYLGDTFDAQLEFGSLHADSTFTH